MPTGAQFRLAARHLTNFPCIGRRTVMAILPLATPYFSAHPQYGSGVNDDYFSTSIYGLIGLLKVKPFGYSSRVIVNTDSFIQDYSAGR
jgi:hypothetical protein